MRTSASKALDRARDARYRWRVPVVAPRARFFPRTEVGLVLAPRQLAIRVAELALAKKAEDVVLIDLRQVTNIADWFVVCTARSDSQLRAVADSIVEGLTAVKHKMWHVEGYESRSWVLLDYVHVVAHIFLPETRAHYALERLWGDAPTENLRDD